MERERKCACVYVWGKRRNEGVIILMLLFVLLKTNFFWSIFLSLLCTSRFSRHAFYSIFLFKIHELMLEIILPYALVVLFFPYVNNIIKVEKNPSVSEESQS